MPQMLSEKDTTATTIVQGEDSGPPSNDVELDLRPGGAQADDVDFPTEGSDEPR